MKNVTLGIIGTNFVSDWLCDSVKVTDGIELAAVYSRTAEKGGEFAAKHEISRVYTDMEEFLSSDIDAVYIATPNFLHFPQAADALRHGKHVLVEKPAALDEEQFKELEKIAAENKVILLEAMRPAHDPGLELVRQSMGEIGTIRRAVFDFCQYSSRYDRYRAGEILNAFNPALGNAALMDIGVYALHVCVSLFGEPESVYAKSVILPNGFEGMGTAFLSYPGMQAEVVYSKITESALPSVITGEDGWVTMGKLSLMESAAVKKRGGEEKILYADRFIDRQENNMIYEAADFAKAVRGELDPVPYNKTTRITLRVMDEIRRQNGIVFPCE